MNFYQERIETDSLIPAKIYLGSAQNDNSHYPLHWHNNLEFDLVQQGRIKGRVNGKPVEVSGGDFFFVNSGDLHETDAGDKNQIHAITILLSYELLKEYSPDIDNYYFDFSQKTDAKEKVKNLILKCAGLYEKQDAFFELEISIVLRQLCVILLKECSKKKQDVSYSRYEEKNIINIKRAISYMEAHYMEEISLKEIAAEIGMAPTYFSRFIKKTTSDTFYGYLTKIRLYHAYMELMNSDATITETALNNGFSNVKSFIEAFKKVYGNTPKKYRHIYLKR